MNAETSNDREAILKLENMEEKLNTGLGYLSGILDTNRVASFELLIWRMCRGNAFVKIRNIPVETEDPATVNKQD